jgi:hypothetical protein
VLSLTASDQLQSQQKYKQQQQCNTGQNKEDKKFEYIKVISI